MTHENIFEIEFVGVMDHDEIENAGFVEVPALDLDVTNYRSDVVLKVKSPCTLLISTSEWTQVCVKEAEEQIKMDTPEPTYTLTKKELEAFVWTGWNMSGEGYNSEYYTDSGVKLQVRVKDVVDEVLNELGKDQTK